MDFDVAIEELAIGDINNNINASLDVANEKIRVSQDPTSDKSLVVKKKVYRASPKTVIQNSIPASILNNQLLNNAIAETMPSNYEFELHKTIHFLRSNNARRVALQLPEGLQMFAIRIATLLEIFVYEPEEMKKLDVVILADVTYGACCVDDFSAIALGCDALIHYGHSCLVPVNVTKIKCMYVFVEITMDVVHFVETVKLNFPDRMQRIALVATVQFLSSLQKSRQYLIDEEGYQNLLIPQVKPLSPGEVLGCTSPRLQSEYETVVYLGDGRFHLESMMISNPNATYYRYDPYSKKITRESYDHQEMRRMRRDAIEQARRAKKFGLVLGTLGRQGSLDVVDWLTKRVKESDPDRELVVVLMSELNQHLLDSFNGSKESDTFWEIDAWIQTSCPRLSIDWGYAFSKPLLTPYEAALALLPEDQWQAQKPRWLDVEEQSCSNCSCDQNQCETKRLHNDDQVYPMDFYSKDSHGPWTPYFLNAQKEKQEREERLKNRKPGSWKDRLKNK